MFKFSAILPLLFLSAAHAKPLRLYDKHERPRVEEIEEKPEDVVCLDKARPYLVFSRADKKRFEQIIKAKGMQVDPNLDIP